MNRIALAYGIAGLAVAIAVATVLGTVVGPTDDDGREDMLLAARGPDRDEAPPLAVAAPPVSEIPAPVPEEVTYVDENGNPLDPAELRRTAARRGHEREEHEEHEDDDDEHEHHRRRGERDHDDD